ncbi:tetratricopeptide repeat protein [Aquimarina pacifica]|uniref:tetratricopeptide repeat protein n=1 Tax=Aquimarina pacifica TaxID=1296415 RepID=UPI000470E65F|nr:tetratricopeptide repeat protein [Aquimarina pacifica]
MTFYHYLLFIATLAVLRPFTIFLHEMGHAIPTLLYTKEGVTIYIGSYGDPKKSLHFRIGRLEIFFKYNPLLWDYGLCVREQVDISINKGILIILMGPLFSLIIGSFCLYIGLFGSDSDSITFISMMIAISSLLDFYHNIVPDSEPITLYSGKQVHNDGQQIKTLLKYRNLPEEYDKCVEYYNNQEFVKSGELFEKIIKSGIKRDFVYRLAISSYLQIKEYDKADKINKDFLKKYKKRLTSIDLYNNGLIKSHKGNLEGSIIDYTESLRLDPNNVYSLNNRGYAYNLSGRYEEAIKDFNKAIELEENFAYALNNRGLSKIKLGDFDNGFIDIKKSLKVDNKNSYCYMNFGIYYFDIGEYHKALENFNIAFEMDKDTYLLSEHIEKTKLKLNI